MAGWLAAWWQGSVEPALAAFFTPEPVLLQRHYEGAAGFETFGPDHLAVLALVALMDFLVVRRYLRLPAGLGRGEPRHRALLAITATPVALLASRDVVLAAEGLLSPIFWPLHICNWCEYLGILWTLTLSDHVADVYFPWACVGGIGALLLPGWGYCPMWTYASLGGFVEHGLMVASCVCMVAGGDYLPDARRLWKPALVGATAGLLFRAANPVWDTNFFFVTQPLGGTPFELAANVCGNPGFLVPYLGCCALLWWGFVLLGRRACLRARRSRG